MGGAKTSLGRNPADFWVFGPTVAAPSETAPNTGTPHETYSNKRESKGESKGFRLCSCERLAQWWDTPPKQKGAKNREETKNWRKDFPKEANLRFVVPSLMFESAKDAGNNMSSRAKRHVA